MVDPVDLAFGEDLAHRVVDRVRRTQVVAERLFEHDARVFVEPYRSERTADRYEERRAGGEIEHANAGQRAHCVAQHAEVFGTRQVELHVEHTLKKTRPRCLVEPVLRDMRLHVLVDPREVRVAIVLVARDRDDLAGFGEQARAVGFIEGRQDLAHRQVAGAAEQHEGEA